MMADWEQYIHNEQKKINTISTEVPKLFIDQQKKRSHPWNEIENWNP